MKRLMLGIFGIGFAFSAVAAERNLNVAVAQEGNEIQIRFTTKAQHSSMCFMKVQELKLKSPNQRSVVLRPGEIDIKAKYDGASMCLMAFGPHRGSATLERGDALPKLEEGEYLLSINGAHYGVLEVNRNDVNLKE